MRSFGVGAFFLIVALAALPAPAEVSGLIVPGQSLGPVSLGMSEAEVAAALGRPVSRPNGVFTFASWKISVTFDGGTAVRISTADPQFRTHRGAGVGTASDAATQLIGDLNQLYTGEGDDLTIIYPFKGIGFKFHGGRAVEIFVIEPIRLSHSSQTPPDETQPGAISPTASSHETPSQGVQVEGLGEVVDVFVGRLVVSGRLANKGKEPIGPVIVTAKFARSDKEDTQTQAVIRQPIAPGAEAPFVLDLSSHK